MFANRSFRFRRRTAWQEESSSKTSFFQAAADWEKLHFFPPAASAIQRSLDDKHNLTASLFANDPELEATFDGERVVRSVEKGPYVGKLQQGLLQLGFQLPKFGADNTYGGETAGAVRRFQQQAGMSAKEQDGIVGKKTLGLLDKSVRNNKVEKDEDVVAEDFTVTDNKQKQKDESCKGKPTDQACPDPNTAVNTAAGQAMDLIDRVLQEQLPPVKTKAADYPQLFTRIFRQNDQREMSIKVAEVRAIYQDIKNFIGRLKTEKDLVRCGTDCDGGCRSGSPAYHTRLRSGKDIITFCPAFETHPERILIVLHECHHAAVPGSADKAYARTRLFEMLDHTQALLNAASFHVYAAWVDKPGSQPVGPAIKDTNLISNADQKKKVAQSLAFIEQWFSLITFDASDTVQGAEEAREKGRYTRNNPRELMEQVFSKWFGLTHPPLAPNKTDIQKLKAMEERLTLMEKAFKNPFVILETTGSSFWSDGPGQEMALNASLLQLDTGPQIIALLQELVHATPGISAESEPLYVLTINDIRNLRNLAP